MSFTLKDSQTTDLGLDRVGTAGQTKRGTSFTAGSSYTCTQIEVLIAKENSPIGNVHCALYADDGSGLEGTLLATSSTAVDSTTLSTTPAYIAFAFAGQALVSGTKYHIVVYGDGGGDGFSPGNLIWERNTSVSGQNISVFEPPSWFEHRANQQLDFKTYLTDSGASAVPEKVNLISFVDEPYQVDDNYVLSLFAPSPGITTTTFKSRQTFAKRLPDPNEGDDWLFLTGIIKGDAGSSFVPSVTNVIRNRTISIGFGSG